MTLPLVIALAATALARARRAPTAGAPPGESGRQVFNASALLILALTMATALVCSRSRMGVASMTVAIVAVGVLLMSRGGRRVRSEEHTSELQSLAYLVCRLLLEKKKKKKKFTLMICDVVQPRS